MQLKTITCTVTVADISTFFVHDLVIYKSFNALSQLTNFVCPIAIDYAYMQCCKFSIPIQNFCMHYWVLQFWFHCCKWKIVCNSGICNFFKCYGNWWFIMALLQLTTFVSPISIHNFCMHHCYSQLLYALL